MTDESNDVIECGCPFLGGQDSVCRVAMTPKGSSRCSAMVLTRAHVGCRFWESVPWDSYDTETAFKLGYQVPKALRHGVMESAPDHLKAPLSRPWGGSE